ncbi:MAG: NAD(P)/FAD-dependent oxidoreductase [Bacteroidia bacterium]
MQTPDHSIFDCAIVGGGLAGLCLAVQLAQRDLRVVLFEKQRYPFHKVCGEYISMESWDFLERLGVPLSDMDLPRIQRLGISSQQGFMLEETLALGGFGISRYSLDATLADLARRAGAVVLDGCKVQDLTGEDGDYRLATTQGDFQARLVCGSYGKISPAFIEHRPRPGRNYIGVKYHIEVDFPADRIELHNFHAGYCGISRVDQGRYCLCYLTTAANLQTYGNDIGRMEQAVLMRNPYLKRIFSTATFLYDKPLVISNVTFRAKDTDSQGAYLLGDAAGTIAPLCGNGMSMAIRAAALLAPVIDARLHEGLPAAQATRNYGRLWRQHFDRRIRVGYYLQYAFGNNTATHAALRTLARTPRLLRSLIGLTHGMPF